MTHRFSGRTALVTGAGSGIGRGVALALAREGAQVVVAGRRRDPLDETLALIEGEGGKGLAVTADVSRADDLHALVATAVDRFGSLDVAVNNAGILEGRGKAVGDLAEADWRRMLDVNVTGVFLALQAEIARMRTQPDGGAIVNIASRLGVHSRLPGAAGYTAGKAAVSVLTRAAALDHIADGVRINAVSPGATATDMSFRDGESEADRAARMRTEVPLGRVSTVAEVAAAVLYLASDDAASVVGADLVIDGGSTA
ncbi:SDR family NAD(P)-dependent oxidoreductase [Streptomyces cyanogenus]|uniref:Glucose 1-dehydrogenase 2 n=1 Tax=Streptomyces cyanogenus TaxID=80860 RepID=A0ABX7TPR3_STRCY|nr:glucose 1-dehydrogenase [Streptomyces cyanogenus]QTD98397.1 Glucose 1-dehydrogenase 2 [Streptomyces cyanogenus]